MRPAPPNHPASRRAVIAVASALGLVSTSVAAASAPTILESSQASIPAEDHDGACTLADDEISDDDDNLSAVGESTTTVPTTSQPATAGTTHPDGLVPGEVDDESRPSCADDTEHDLSDGGGPHDHAPEDLDDVSDPGAPPADPPPDTSSPPEPVPAPPTPPPPPASEVPASPESEPSSPDSTPPEPDPDPDPEPTGSEEPLAPAEATSGADRLTPDVTDDGPDPLEPAAPDVPPVVEEPVAPLPVPDTRWLGGTHRFDAPRGPGPSLPRPGRTPAAERTRLTDDVDVILATIRQLESGERYEIGPNRAGASGAYQYIPSTWNGEAGYAEAYLAPPEIQDGRARADVERFLAMYGGDVSMVPVMWYYPRAAVDPSWMDRVPNPAGGNRLTIREYQERWLDLLVRNTEAMLGTQTAVADGPAAASVLSSVPQLATDQPTPIESGPIESVPVEPADDPIEDVPNGDDEPVPPPIEIDAVYVADETLDLAARSIPPRPLDEHGLGSMRSIVFPVLGPATYHDGWGDPRDGGERRHEGTDIIGVKMQPLLAAVDGVITHLRVEPRGISGVALSIQDADGWRYNYFHLNNDTPGTDDDLAETGFRLVPGLEVGSEVVAGQVIGYMGDSGNAEDSVPHLHFEFRDPEGRARPSYWSLKFAEARQACSIAIGPWATPNALPWIDDETDDENQDETAETDAVDQIDTVDTVWHTVVTPLFGEGEWVIDSQGRVTATGDAALIVPSRQLECDPGPSSPFGTDAGGWGDISFDSLDGTVWADVDLTDTPLDGVVPPAPDEDSHDETETETETVGADVIDEARDEDDPIARPLVFTDPATGERIIVVFDAVPIDVAPNGAA